MREIDPQNVCPSWFRGARNYKARTSVTAVRLEEPVVLVTLLGREVGHPGDYLCRARKTGMVSLVSKRLFDRLCLPERETLDDRRGTVIA